MTTTKIVTNVVYTIEMSYNADDSVCASFIIYGVYLNVSLYCSRHFTVFKGQASCTRVCCPAYIAFCAPLSMDVVDSAVVASRHLEFTRCTSSLRRYSNRL